MAWYECLYGGGQLNETVLWTNSNPTASFSQQLISLSDDFRNYDYIKITVRTSTTKATEYSVIYPYEEFVDAVTSVNGCRPAIGVYDGAQYARTFYIQTNTYNKIGANYCYKLAATTNSNDRVIPIKITGLKL